jgi:hypothetical protein
MKLLSEYLIQENTLTAIGDATRSKTGKTATLSPFEMIEEITNIEINSGNAGLNFKIVGSTTKPNNPSENTIWIDTDTEINGWFFSDIEPTNPVEGLVWLYVNPSSTIHFNALTENGIRLNLSDVKQYISNTWVDKTS